MGKQKGNIIGRDLIFLQKSYYQYHLKTKSEFYNEGLRFLGKLEIRKGVKTLKHWDDEHIFFNPLLTRKNGKTHNVIPYCYRKRIFTYDQLIEEKRKQLAALPFDKVLTKILDKIFIFGHARKHDIFIAHNGEETDLAQTTQKLYSMSKLYYACGVVIITPKQS